MPAIAMLSEPIIAWIQPMFHPEHLITITRTDGTVDDLTGLTQFSFTNLVTDGIGSFTVTVPNGSQAYTGLWATNNQVKLYMDYAQTASTLTFLGRIEKIVYGTSNIYITGRSEALQLLGVTVTQSYENKETSWILNDIISKYNPSAGAFTFSAFVSSDPAIKASCTSTAVMTLNWYQKPFWDCVKELCEAAGFDCYVNASKDFQYFAKRTRFNTTEAAVHDMNITETGQFGPDWSQVKNRIIVYGATIDNQKIMATAQDQASFDQLGCWKEQIINDNNITTGAQATERANNELAIAIVPPVIGEITVVGLPTLNPGEMLRISDPINSIDPGSYRIYQFEHSFVPGESVMTKVHVEKKSLNIPLLFKSRIENEQQSANTENPNEMRYSYVWTFDDDTDTQSYPGMAIVDGVLKGVGTWKSIVITAPPNVTALEIRSSGSSVSGTVYTISLDGGVNQQAVSPNRSYTPDELGISGSQIQLIINIISDNCQITTASCMWRVD